MINDKKIICVIPARLHSSRFPKKVLTFLRGKPLLQWSWEAACKVPYFDEVFFALDSQETAEIVDGFGGKYYMTSDRCLAATDRIIEVQQRKLASGDIWVNWQADEPFVNKAIIDDLLKGVEDSDADIWTLKTLIEEKKQVENPNIAKVVCDQQGRALYFSRNPIPYLRPGEKTDYYKHVGLYAYKDAALVQIKDFAPSELERAESLEQLRFLEGGLTIHVNETHEETLGIDLPEHLVAAEEYAKKHLNHLLQV